MKSIATLPEAPGLFSTTTGWPSFCDKPSADRRARISGIPPGEVSTTRRRLRFGYLCAVANKILHTQSAAAPTAPRIGNFIAGIIACMEVISNGTVGAEVKGIALARLSRAEIDAVKQAWYRH